MDEQEQQQDFATATDLFTLRIWRESLGEGRVEWRGKVQHVLTGEARYFRGWRMLIGQLESILAQVGAGAPSSPPPAVTRSPRTE